MIFDMKAVMVMNRYVVRKGCEIALITMDTCISEAERHLRIDRLMMQMSKARMISAIGCNDLTEVPLNMHIISAPVPDVPPRMLAEYTSSLGDRDRDDELLFEGYSRTLFELVPYLREAVAIYESEDPVCGIDDTDMLLYRRGLDRAEGMDADIYRILLRVGSLKYVPNGTISAVIGYTIDEPHWREVVPLLIARSIMNCNSPVLAGLSDSPMS